MEKMEPIKLVSETEIREIYRQGEAAVLLIIQTISQLSSRIQILEDQIAKISGNLSMPPSSNGLWEKK
jgi:hypothetical protein